MSARKIRTCTLSIILVTMCACQASVPTLQTPKAPTSLVLSSIKITQVDLSWSDESDNEDGFRVERRDGSSTSWIQVGSVGANVRLFKDAGLTPNTDYAYRVRAFNAKGNSSCSNEASCKTLSSASGAIGQEGGTIEVTDSASPIFGAKVVVPPGAVDPGTTVNISINYTDSLPASIPSPGVQTGKGITLEKDIELNFRLPVLVTVPYDASSLSDLDMPCVFYWDEYYHKYRAVAVRSIDRSSKFLTFSTAHFTNFWTFSILNALYSNLGLGSDSGFRPDQDGFFHRNFGSFDSPGGCCLGMALYSQWYYSNKKSVDTNGLFFKYRQGDYSRWEDDSIARELISRAMIASSQIWAWLWYMDDLLKPGDTATELWTALLLTGDPQTLLMRGCDPCPTSKWGHAVTVYGWDSAAKQFLIYDSNYPGEKVTVDWAADGFKNYSKAAAYGKINNMAFEGMSTILKGKEFETFYTGAEGGWPTSKFQTISVTSPALDAKGMAEVPDFQAVTIKGTVSGGTQQATRLIYFLNGTQVSSTSVDPNSHAFSITINSLPLPSNEIMLVGTDDRYDPWGDYNGFREFTLNVQGRTFLVNGGFETGDFSGWDHETHTWQSSIQITPEKSGIETIGTDPIDPTLNKVYSGNYSARVNNYDPNYHISTISQSVIVPNATNPQIQFFWAAVLEDPNHPAAYQPYVDITVTDDATNAVVFSRHFYSYDPGYSGWKTVYRSGIPWRVIPWQSVVLYLSGQRGNRITIKISAADCDYGGHGGYVYLDGVDQ